VAAFDVFIETSLHGNTSVRALNIAVDCPFCGRSGKLWIHRQSGLCQCFGPDCNYKGNAVKLVMDVDHIPYDQAFLQVAQALKNQVQVRLGNAEAKNIDFCETMLRALLKDHGTALRNDQKITLPKGAVPIAGTAGVQYLLSRGFGRTHYRHYHLQFCSRFQTDRQYANHIVFPDFVPGTKVLRYWTTRTAYEPEYGPKSRNPEGIEKESILYGEGEAIHAQNSGTIVLVEGPLDALALHGHAVALLGKVLSSSQALRLAAQYKRVVVCLDRSAGRDVLPVIEQLRAFGVSKCMISHADEDDPAEAVKQGNKQILQTLRYNAKRATTRTLLQIKLRGRV